MSELPSSEDLDPSTGTDAPTPPTTTGPSSYTLNWEEPAKLTAASVMVCPFLLPGRAVCPSSWNRGPVDAVACQETARGKR